MSLFSNPFYIQYWNKKTPGFIHESLCQNDEDMVRIINNHRKNNSKEFEFRVWELIPVEPEDLEVIIEENG